MSGPKAVKTLENKYPECPECGEVSTLYISGVEKHKYKCHGENKHKFPRKTEELLTEKEIEDLIFEKVDKVESLLQLKRLLHSNFEFKVELIADPHDGIVWGEKNVPVKHWLRVYTTDKAVLTQKLDENPYLAYKENEGITEIVKKPSKEVAENGNRV